MRRILILFFLFSITIAAQKKKSTDLGNVTLKELKMKLYEKDSTASAVVLYEHANYYIDPSNDFKFRTDYYFKVKILKNSGANKSIVKINLYKKEKAFEIKGVSHNVSENNTQTQQYLLDENIFSNQINEKWKEVSFTLPEVKKGTVIEYKYSILSPYSQIDDWYFQSDIPKVRSDFTAAILGNWKYNVRVIGYLKLDRDHPSIKNNCVYVPGLGNGSCVLYDYGMDSIPAFKEENYMLSKRNFISKISFDLMSYTNTRGEVNNYSKSWKNADRELKSSFLDNQASKKKYFKKHILSDTILSVKNELKRAKKTYAFIKDHFTWNEKYWPSRKVKIKKAFENKSGNIFDINLSLYNALKASDINCEIVLLATRNKGRPTKLFPVYDDFNYLIVKVVINGKTYYLDASNKNMPFGLIQFEALNGEGRVMDFKKGSYWESIKLNKRSNKTTRISLKLTDEKFSGRLSVKSTGYYALNKRNEIDGKSEDDILNSFETKYPYLEAESMSIGNEKSFEKPLNEVYKINLDAEFLGATKIRLNPFIIDRSIVNPFKLNERKYPVDFGYERTKIYVISLAIPESYSVIKIPKQVGLSLPNDGGKLIFKVQKKEASINFYLKFSIAKKSYSNIEYHYLKQFYQKLIDIQNSHVELEKNN